jgi:hypothetical protein
MAIFTLFYLQTTATQAHGVVVWAEVIQDQVRVEANLTNGHSLAGAQVEVLDRAGNQLLQGRLNKLGQFEFPVPQRHEVLIRVSLGEGHSGEYSLQIE